jgi:hypothetical protein
VFQNGDVHATQQMGVNMSNAVKREGGVIIQNQNIEVYARIPQHLLVKDGLPSRIQIVKFYFQFYFQ